MQPTLKNIIIDQIKSNGVMAINDYWALCLSHPEHGYYMKQDPLGQKGDFTTAPEISQLFGEMIAIWVADEWQRLGCPNTLHLVECGPGRGTLMADLLRIAKMAPDFDASLQVHLVETSSALISRQKENLSGKNVTWHADLSTLPQTEPLVIIGNEFLDALPIEQFIKHQGRWHERVIALDAEGHLIFQAGDTVNAFDFPEADDGEIFERSATRDSLFSQMCQKINEQSGSIVMIDYGYKKAGIGDTLQAVASHQFADILDNQGDADLTSHVNFEQLETIALNQNCHSTISNQKEFLIKNGIVLRANQLKEQATNSQSLAIDAALHRLLGADQMGELFKVIEVRS